MAAAAQGNGAPVGPLGLTAQLGSSPQPLAATVVSQPSGPCGLRHFRGEAPSGRHVLPRDMG